MKKLLFAGHDLKFAQFLIDYYSSDKEYEVKIDQWKGHNIHDINKSSELLNWADIIFCEWGLGNAVWYSNNKKKHQKLIVRMHAQEKKTKYPTEFNYENIDKIITISPYIYEELYRIFKLPRDKMKMIYNCVDYDKFNLPKIDNYKYNLGIIGIIPKLKRLDLAIDIIEKLANIDNRYCLYIKGKKPDEIEWLKNNESEISYYNDLMKRIENSKYRDNIVFDGYGNDIDQWLRKIGYVLSTSDSESFHLAPAEGMASGAYPIIFNWDGCTTIYDDKWIVKSTEEAVEKVINSTDKEFESSILKKYILDNFDKKIIIEKYKEII